jgi:hypothetical protein
LDDEVKHAYPCGTPILPIRLEGVVLLQGLRFVLSNVQWIDATLEPARTHAQIERAVRALARREARQ